MPWIRSNAHWLSLAGVVLTTLALGGVAGLAVVTFLTAVGTGVAPSLALLDAVGTYLLPALLLAGLDLLFGVALVVTLVRRAASVESERLASVVRTVEDHALGRDLGLAERFEPSVESRREELKRAYTAGDISEHEFERRLDDLLEREDGGGTVGAGIDADLERERERERAR